MAPSPIARQPGSRDRAEIRIAFQIAIILCFASALSRPRYAWAQLVRHNSYTPITVEDPVPGNDFVVAQPEFERSRSGDSLGYSSSIRKQLSPKSMLNLSTQWTQVWPRHGRPQSGFTYVDVLPLYELIGSAEHSFILAAAADFHIATGGPAGAGADDTTRLGPFLLWAKGMGNLSNRGWGRYMRPFLLQGDAGYSFATSHVGTEHVSADLALSYSIPFMKQHVTWIRVGPPLSKLIPFAEFNYDETVVGSGGRTPPDFRVMPGLAILTSRYQLALGAQLPLNHTAAREDRFAIIGLVDIFYDHLIPALGANLF